ncbi:hypothetical protein C7S14_4934 [Burkholderia cepacia]|nr:hypothetical protein C7S14_4934 [Burkholderia cepacia]
MPRLRMPRFLPPRLERLGFGAPAPFSITVVFYFDSPY